MIAPQLASSSLQHTMSDGPQVVHGPLNRCQRLPKDPNRVSISGAGSTSPMPGKRMNDLEHEHVIERKPSETDRNPPGSPVSRGAALGRELLEMLVNINGSGGRD